MNTPPQDSDHLRVDSVCHAAAAEPVPARLALPKAVANALYGLFPGSEVAVESEMRRHGSHLYVLHVEGQGRYIAKFGHKWSISTLEVITSNCSVLRQALTTDGGVVAVVQIVGQTSDPPGVVMEYVDGMDLSSLITRASIRSASAGDKKRARELVALAGFALGQFHASDKLEQPQSRTLGWVRRRFRLPRYWAIEANDALYPVWNVNDFAPYNLRVTTDNGLCIVDIAGVRRVVSAHEDCAHFLAGLSLSVFEAQWHYRARQGRLFADLRKSFLDGYSTSGPIDLRDPKHERLLDWTLSYKITEILVKLARLKKYLSILMLVPLLWPALKERILIAFAQQDSRSGRL